MSLRKRFRGLSLAALAIMSASCHEPASPPQTASPPAGIEVGRTQTYAVKGEVIELMPDGRTARIRHEEIPGYMPAMTMPFEVKDTNELAGLRAGDLVSFRMLVTETEGWIDQITRREASPPAGPAPRDSTRQVRFVEPLSPGDPLPDYPFTNELNQPVSLGQFKGNALGFTFIFTRCPFPNFCPRMSSNFAEAYKQLTALPGGPKNWRLLSISFDPEFDSPAVLKAYAGRYRHDTNHWSFVTGAWSEIDAITEQFGLEFSRAQSGIGWDHKLRTVVIDARGTVQKVFTGNEWKVDDFVAEMIKAAEVKP